MDWVLLALFILNMLLSVIVAYIAEVNYGKNAKALQAVEVLDKRCDALNDRCAVLDGRTREIVSISKDNNDIIRGEFDEHDEEIRGIIKRMEAVEAGIRSADHKIRDISSYYVNYVSKKHPDAIEECN